MRPTTLFILILLSMVSGTASAATTRQTAVTYTRADSLRVVSLLSEARRVKRGTNLMLHFARQLLGVPYVAHTLEGEREERLVVNLRELDCTTLIETVTALTLCAARGETTFGAYCERLRGVRYTGGEVAYTRRKHYFTVWIEDNARQGTVVKIEPSAADLRSGRHPFTATQRLSVNYMTAHAKAYTMLAAHPGWLPEIRAMERTMDGKQYRFIPKRALRSTKANNQLLRRYIKDGDIIVILTSIAGLDTSHIGMAVWHTDGLHMLNASSVHRRVVEEPMLLATYMARHPKQRGIRLVRVKH